MHLNPCARSRRGAIGDTPGGKHEPLTIAHSCRPDSPAGHLPGHAGGGQKQKRGGRGDGLAPAREPIYNPRIYRPSLRFNPSDRTWRGTIISVGVPAGEYEKVVLVVQDDFGGQAKCQVGKISVQP